MHAQTSQADMTNEESDPRSTEGRGYRWIVASFPAFAVCCVLLAKTVLVSESVSRVVQPTPEVIESILKSSGDVYFGVYDSSPTHHHAERKVGWSRATSNTVDFQGVPAIEIVYEERLSGQYYGKLRESTTVFRQVYDANPPYKLLMLEDQTDEAGFRKKITAVPQGAECRFTILEGTSQRVVTKPYIERYVTGIISSECLIKSTAPVSSRLESWVFNATELEFKPYFEELVARQTKDGRSTVEIHSSSPMRGVTSTATWDADSLQCLSWKAVGGYERIAESAEQAKSNTGLYVYLTNRNAKLKGSVEQSTNLLREFAVEVSGDWLEFVKPSDMQAVGYDQKSDTTWIKVGKAHGQPVKATEDERTKALEENGDYPTRHPLIQKMAAQAVENATSEMDKVERIVGFLSRFLRYQIDLDPLSVLETVHAKRGDCSEFSDLFVTLARATGLPARSVSGWVVMSPERMSFHAWAEVLIDGHWVSVDPTWHQPCLDAGHIRMSADLDDIGLAGMQRFIQTDFVFTVQMAIVDVDYYEDLYGQLVERHPSVPAYYQQLATAQRDAGKLDAAIATLTKVIEREPQAAEALALRGDLYRSQSNYESALSDYVEATRLQPEEGEFWSGRGATHTDLAQFDEAIVSLTKAIALNPHDPLAFFRRGFALQANDDYNAALADYANAIQLRPKYSGLWYRQALCFDDAGQVENAVVSLTKAVSLEKSNSTYLRKRAELFERLGRSDEAQRDLKQADSLDDEADTARGDN